jgi:hypothetical protein
MAAAMRAWLVGFERLEIESKCAKPNNLIPFEHLSLYYPFLSLSRPDQGWMKKE